MNAMQAERGPIIESDFYRPGDRSDWDDFVARSANGGLLHSRRFLDYHGTRLHDISLLFREAGKNGLTGVMPLVAVADRAHVAVSHPGSSFGGLVTLRPDPMMTASMFVAACGALREAGFRSLEVLTHPTVFHRQPDEADFLFLSQAGKITEMHLWSVVQVGSGTVVKKKRAAAVRAAKRSGLSIAQSDATEDYARFHATVVANLGERHNRKPVHSFQDMMALKERLGESARLLVASHPDLGFLGGTWLWDYGNGTWHSQYLCSNAEGKRLNAVDAIILDCQERAGDCGQRLYSIGRNTLGDGWSINLGLLNYKKRLGCGLVAQHRIVVQLADLQDCCGAWIARQDAIREKGGRFALEDYDP